MSRRPAVFLDRDGTLTLPRQYPSHPDDLVLQPSIGPPLRRLVTQGFAIVLVTNQSGLARGFFSNGDLDRMHRHLDEQLGRIGVQLDAIYVCPHHVEGCIPALAVDCSCRKPNPGMVLQAARDLRLDLAASWLIGDADSDIEAGRRAGCRTIQTVTAASGRRAPRRLEEPTLIAATTAEALSTLAGLQHIPLAPA